MTRSLGCAEWDAEEDVGEWQDCRELCLGAHHQLFESAGSGVLGGFTGGCYRPSDWEEAANGASDNWREAPVSKPRSPQRTLTPLFSAGTRAWQDTSHGGGFWNAFVTTLDQGGHSRSWFAGLLPCLQGKINHGCEDGRQPFRGTLTSWRNGPKEFHEVPKRECEVLHQGRK